MEQRTNKTAKLTQEDISKLATVFELLISMDKKQNPHLYTKPSHNLPSEPIQDSSVL